MKFYLYDENYAEYWELKNQLAACETVAEVEAITWPEASK